MQRHYRSLAARYKGQSFELEITQTTGNIAAAFHRAHRVRYGYAQETNTVEIVSARLRSSGIVEKLRQPRLPLSSKVTRKPHDYTEAFFAGRKVRAGIYRRDELPAGARLDTPCIVTEYSSTTLIPPGATASAERHGNLPILIE